MEQEQSGSRDKPGHDAENCLSTAGRCGHQVDRRRISVHGCGCMSDPSTQTSVLARFVTDSSTARRLLDSLAEAFEPGETAVAAFEEEGAWTIEISFERPPDEDAVRRLVGDLAGEAARERL